MTGTAPEAGLLLVALDGTGPALLLALVLGVVYLSVDHLAARLAFWGMAALCAALIIAALVLSPAYGSRLISGRLVADYGTSGTRSFWYVPWATAGVALVPLIRFKVRRRL